MQPSLRLPPPLLRFLTLSLALAYTWCPTGVSAVDVLSLDGSWIVYNANGSIRAAGRVPGGIYTDLRAAGILTSDLFSDYNDGYTRWVGYDNWTYERTFEVEESLLQRRHVQLVLHGVDGSASVWLNEQQVGVADNSFVRFSLAAKRLLRAGRNSLALRFVSPALDARARFERHQRLHGYAVLPDCVPPEYHGECHANHVRRMQASFSWDWGPAFPSVGLWKSVALEAFDSAVVRAVTTHFVGTAAWSVEPDLLHVHAHLEAGAGDRDPLRGRLTATLRLEGDTVTAAKDVQIIPDEHGRGSAQLTLPLENAPLWWPNGEGNQPLVPLEVQFQSSEGEKTSWDTRVAFRTIELVQEPIERDNPESGLSFYFRVNQRPIFAKGSNWIPANVLPELGTDKALVRSLLQSARDVHMNMLRVWGGGVYESDVFYEVADELGILIWQDLMFACSMYPADSDFLTSVSEEVRQQVLRLQPHPSVALWAGNNENEAALVQNWYGTAVNFSLYRNDYLELYAKTLRPLVMDLDPTRHYVVSSPSNGLKTDEEGFVSKNPGDPLYGDVHYYNYLSDGWNVEPLPRPRFCSEYGFQSLPSLATLRQAISNPEDLCVTSRLMQSRQHHPAGYEEIAAMIAKRLPLPEDWETVDGFAQYAFLSQIYQAVATQTETEHYRRLRNFLTGKKEGHCMGALYWQLNDVWQAPTWSSIEFGGRWKALHYLAADFFSPILASPYVSIAGGLYVAAINDRPQPILEAQLQVRAGRWDKLATSYNWRDLSKPFELKAQSSQSVVISADVHRLINSNPDCGSSDRKECFLVIRMLALPDRIQLGPERLVLLSPPKDALGLKTPKLMVTSVTGPLEDGTLELEVKTDRPAVFVWLEAATTAGRFSRNAFLLDQEKTTLKFIPAAGTEPPTAEHLRKDLSVVSVVAEDAQDLPNDSYMKFEDDKVSALQVLLRRLPQLIAFLGFATC